MVTDGEDALRSVRATLQLAIDATADGIWEYNPQERSVFWSDRFKQMLGLDPRWEISVEAWRELLHPEDQVMAAEQLRKYISGELPTYDNVYRLRHADGTYRWMHSRGRAEWGSDKKLIRVVGGVTDITQRRQAEIALQASEARWRAVTEAMPQLVWIDRASDGWCEYLSSQWTAFTGQPVEDLLGFAWLELLHPDDKERTAHAWAEAVAERADYNIEYRIRRFDGVYRWFKVRGVPIRDASGKISQWYGTCTDIHDLKEAEVRAEAANVAKSEFLATMSHEIRTPMNAIIGLSSILATTHPLTAKQTTFIETLKSSAESLLTLINDLLDISKIEARSVELEDINFSLKDLIQQIAAMMALRVNEKKLQLITNLAAIDQFYFIGDPSRLKQIVTNLCSNAIKFTDYGTITITAKIDQIRNGDIAMVTLIVNDSGIGIAPEKRETIFDKFVQADSSISRRYGGTGLGLAITKTLVDLMHGSISVESVEGEGSTFIVKLPLKLGTKESEPVIETHSHPKPPSSANRTILLVEDYPANILVARTFLETANYNVEVASDGNTAVAAVRAKRYNAVMMDIQMPGVSGFEATTMIRQHERDRNLHPVPILGLTAHAQTSDRDLCLRSGMNDYLSKPYDLEVLLGKLAKLIGND